MSRPRYGIHFEVRSRSSSEYRLTHSPREEMDAPTEILQTHVMSSSLGKFVDADGKKLGGFVS